MFSLEYRKNAAVLLTAAFFVFAFYPQVSFAATEGSGLLHFINTTFFKETLPDVKLSEEDLAHVTKPGIVRIVHHMKGELVIDGNFDIDLNKLTIVPLPAKAPIKVPVDVYYTGTGFIITPNGHILTNSHVISKTTVMSEAVTKILTVLIAGKLQRMTEAQYAAFTKKGQTAEGLEQQAKFAKSLREEAMNIVSFEGNDEVVVLNGSSADQDDTLVNLVSKGFPARVVSVNHEFLNDQKDVAIVKIGQSNLPSLPFVSSSTSFVIGNRIYAFGFPANADIGSKVGTAFTVPSFTTGVISAFKDSDDKKFKLIQTDTKISSGSSGSPAFNKRGEVEGIMTYVTSSNSKTSGDIFSFAIPNEVVKELLDQAEITPETGDLYTYFIEGLSFYEAKRCTDAMKAFNKAREVNTTFGSSAFVDEYIQKCKDLQAAGLSIDSEWEKLMFNLKPWRGAIIISVSALFVFFVLLLVFMKVFRKMKQDEEVIEHYVHPIAPVATTTPPSISPSVVEDSGTDIVKFIKMEQSVGRTTVEIVTELRSKGHTDEEIQQGFNEVNR